MKLRGIFSLHSFLSDNNQYIYENTGSWFIYQSGIEKKIEIPSLVLSPKGILLKNTNIKYILATRDIFEIRKTDADAIFIDFLFVPGEKRLKELFSASKKPVIASVRLGHTTPSKLPMLAKQLEFIGASAIYVGRMVPAKFLKEICSICCVPVISELSTYFGKDSSKVQPGVSAVCVNGSDDTSFYKILPLPMFVYSIQSEIIDFDSRPHAIIYRPYDLE